MERAASLLMTAQVAPVRPGNSKVAMVYGAVQAQVHRNSEQHLFRELLLGGGPS